MNFKAKRLQRLNSKSHLLFLSFILLLGFIVAVALRYYALEPLRIMDTTMYPRHGEKEILWVCKLPQCINNVKANETVWAKQRNGETTIRRILGMPGDSIYISDQGRVRTSQLKFRWPGEDAFIESRKFYVPKKGDTLSFDELGDIEQDYIIGLLEEQGVDFYIQTSLWLGDRELSLEHVGTTKIGTRQVSLKEIDLLPWQDRFLIEKQLEQNEPGNAKAKIQRKLYNRADSSLISKIPITYNCYYLVCQKSSHCADSRELGYYTQKRIIGRFIKEPTTIMKFVTQKVTVVKEEADKIFEKGSNKTRLLLKDVLKNNKNHTLENNSKKEMPKTQKIERKTAKKRMEDNMSEDTSEKNIHRKRFVPQEKTKD